MLIYARFLYFMPMFKYYVNPEILSFPCFMPSGRPENDNLSF